MSSHRPLAFLALALAAAPTLAAPTLVGFASLPADTFASGPSAGHFLAPVNGRTPPFPSQPVQGFSAIGRGEGGRFLALSDNGFGAQGNSADALLLVHELGVDFRTASGGSGAVQVLGSTPLSDPNRLVNFEIVAAKPFYPNGAGDIPVAPEIAGGRLLTGADFDIESFRRDAQGNYWFGDEFGPFLIKTDARFEVIAPPLPTPGVQSPQNPFLGTGTANLSTSRGFEGMAISPDGGTLYPLLEGTVTGDPPGTLRILEVDIAGGAFTGRQWLYPLDPLGAAIGDFTQVNERELLVIERDNEQGAAARHKKVYLVDLTRVDGSGRLQKTELVDLLAIEDPFDLNLDSRTLFGFPFVTIESILPIDPYTLLIANDNNYPFSVGRGPDIDNNELILVRLDAPLNLAVPVPASPLLVLAGLAAIGLRRGARRDSGASGRGTMSAPRG